MLHCRQDSGGALVSATQKMGRPYATARIHLNTRQPRKRQIKKRVTLKCHRVVSEPPLTKFSDCGLMPLVD